MIDSIEGQVSPIDVKEWIAQKKQCYLFDLRDKEESQKNPIKPFQVIPATQVSKIIPQINTENIVFLLCQDSTRSIEAQKIFASCGISSFVIRGGATDWQKI